MQPTIRTYVLAELKCYLCGTTAGFIERERGSTAARVAIQRGGNVGTIGAWEASRVRCPRCGGGVYIDQVEIVDRRTEPLEWDDEGPRRGRPPKWLVEQRRRKLERERRTSANAQSTSTFQPQLWSRRTKPSIRLGR